MNKHGKAFGICQKLFLYKEKFKFMMFFQREVRVNLYLPLQPLDFFCMIVTLSGQTTLKKMGIKRGYDD